ncbi:hypothetical protein QN277_017031 [Acacia crassicarpa]|uniref:Uncharacterized protein n=1 Tax=Acacia crassicarpa TaxID=499986 RepID=A0AAE1JMQ2_9FABA|nr:hypothetical protein QN277_017031 [Acacia crassicarpa]
MQNQQIRIRWVKLSGSDLLPMDVVSSGCSSGQNGEKKSVPANMLISPRSAIVNEAILTGKPTSQWKMFSVLKTGVSDISFSFFYQGPEN